ncbi:hypothetical protein M0804_006912 [Polistes exclamans]|nr:hypothetical protein M0804_006912 [Polistes exclamans]
MNCFQDRMTANGNSPLDSMRTLEHYLNDIMRAGAADTPEHLKASKDTLLCPCPVPLADVYLSRYVSSSLHKTKLRKYPEGQRLALKSKKGRKKRATVGRESQCRKKTIVWKSILYIAVKYPWEPQKDKLKDVMMRDRRSAASLGAAVNSLGKLISSRFVLFDVVVVVVIVIVGMVHLQLASFPRQSPGRRPLTRIPPRTRESISSTCIPVANRGRDKTGRGERIRSYELRLRWMNLV